MLLRHTNAKGDTMDITFAGASALEIIRLVRTSPHLMLARTIRFDPSWCDSPRGSMSKVNFLALGLAQPPTNSRPANIRVPSAAHRHQVEAVRCLVFPKGLPTNSFLQLIPTNQEGSERFEGMRVFVDCIPLACTTIAASYQRLIKKGKMQEIDAIIQLVELIMEFTGHYSRDPASPRGGSITEELSPAATLEDFRAFIAESTYVPGKGLIKMALPLASEGARSVMEACLWIMNTFPEDYGFYGFSGCRLNAPIVPTSSQRILMQHKTLTPDLVWEKERVAIEYQGFEEHRSKTAHIEDNRRMNDYQICNMLAFFVTFDDVRNISSFDRLARRLATAMEQKGATHELERINRLLDNDFAHAERARQLSRLLPPVSGR